MKRLALTLCLLPLLCMAAGCSNKLTRREAARKIDAMMKPHPAGSQQIMSPGGNVPGYELPDSYRSTALLRLGRIGADLEMPLESALLKLGYITLQDAGPADLLEGAVTMHWNKTVIVSLTDKVGKVVGRTPNTENGATYQNGFECPTEPRPVCSLPLVEIGRDFQITGIIQDQIHAKVNILIPWKLTQLGLDLKPYAKSDENKPLYDFELWEKFLNSHSASGSDPATILFQKYDDGWRIVDMNGSS